MNKFGLVNFGIARVDDNIRGLFESSFESVFDGVFAVAGGRFEFPEDAIDTKIGGFALRAF